MGSYAEEYRSFFYNLFRFGFKLSKEELKAIMTTSGIIAFVWSFDKWGGATFNAVEGITNFALGLVFSMICLFFNQIGQRIVAVHYGYDPVYESGMIGLMIALVVTFASRGLLIFFVPGGMILRHLAASRLGEFRYYTNDWEWAKAGFMGPLFNILLAAVLAFFKTNPYVNQLIVMNIMFAAYSLLPLPGNVGLYLFYPHLYFWTFTVGFVAVSSVLIYFINPLLAIGLGLMLGAALMFKHYTADGRL
ncbi:MAG: hypothetical protein HGA85_06655 [Nanoarchaeota archaeon]|nr:hypothetical protein [Nanoarchaeota archaeon]